MCANSSHWTDKCGVAAIFSRLVVETRAAKYNHWDIHTYIHTYIHTGIHTNIHTCSQTVQCQDGCELPRLDKCGIACV